MMINYSIVQLQGLIKGNLYVGILLVILSCHCQVQAWGSAEVEENQELMSTANPTDASRQKNARIEQVYTRMPAKNVANEVKQDSSVSATFAQRTATSIATKFTYVLDGLDSVTGLPSLCSNYIAKPLRNAWLQARKLNNDGITSNVSQEEIGLLNEKIDNIVNSVTEMYNKGLSSKEIGNFVTNSVKLALITPVVGAGAGAGLMLGSAGGAVVGAGKGVGYVFGSGPTVHQPGFFTGFMLGDAVGSGGDVLAPVLVGAAVAGTAVVAGAAAVGGVYGAVTEAPKGARAGARYTSKFLQSPKKAIDAVKKDMYGPAKDNLTNQNSVAQSAT